MPDCPAERVEAGERAIFIWRPVNQHNVSRYVRQRACLIAANRDLVTCIAERRVDKLNLIGESAGGNLSLNDGRIFRIIFDT